MTSAIRIDTPVGQPEVVRAAGLLLAALKRSKLPDLRSFALAVAADHGLVARVGLSDEQWALVRAWSRELAPLLSRTDARVTLAACPQCGRWAYVPSQGSIGARCWMGLDCQGKPVRAVAARTVHIERH